MNRNDLAVIALRVLAIYWALQIIPVFPSIYFAREPWLIALNVLLLVVRVALCYWIWHFAPELAIRILPEYEPNSTPAAFSLEALQTIAFSVLGLGLLVFGVGAFITYFSMFLWDLRVQNATSHSVVGATPRMHLELVVGGIIEMIAGAWLFFGAENVGRYWRRLHTPTVTGTSS